MQYCGRWRACILPSSREGSWVTWRGSKAPSVMSAEQIERTITSWSKLSSFMLVHTWIARAYFWVLEMASAPTLVQQGSKCGSTRPLLGGGWGSFTSLCVGPRDMNDANGLFNLLKVYICGQHRDQSSAMGPGDPRGGLVKGRSEGFLGKAVQSPESLDHCTAL